MSDVRTGNLLGNPRAENDQLLDDAFLETADYATLLRSTDYNFVVGRRGTGKSALFRKVKQHFEAQPAFFLCAETPREYETLELQNTISQITNDYAHARFTTRVAWRLHLLCLALTRLESYYKINRSETHTFFLEYVSRYPQLFSIAGPSRCSTIIKSVLGHGKANPLSLPGLIVSYFQVERLQQAVQQALIDVKRVCVVMFDSLDEGWLPTPVATAVLGGLASAISDVTEGKVGIYAVAFIRDNIFRALAYFDGDFSRHIEPNTMRLRWFPNGLLAMVAKRLRRVLRLDIESDVRVWNRFARRELSDHQGFESALKHTLYRPRDILVLLNIAYSVARAESRTEIVGGDLEIAARTISKDRLSDLQKEYDKVLPGIGLFVRAFQGAPVSATLDEVISVLDNAIASSDYAEHGSGDFALFSSGNDAAVALYSVGFFGIQSGPEGRFRFCHDGSLIEVEPDRPNIRTIIHPCYWIALSSKREEGIEEVSVQIDDDLYGRGAEGRVRDLRVKLLGQVREEYRKFEIGSADCEKFEEWTLRTARILFGGELSHFQLTPNPIDPHRRDVTANNTSKTGFWHKVLVRLGSRKIVFLAKNFVELRESDFREILAYDNSDFGSLIVAVTRSETEALSTDERSQLVELYRQHKRILLALPASLLARCVSKLRTAEKYDYTEKRVSRHMDIFVKSYLRLRQEQAYR